MKILRQAIHRIKRLTYGELKPVPFDASYPWLGYQFQEMVKDPTCRRKPMYCWGVLQGAALARVLGIEKMSALEFGVAGGSGLLALERIADVVEAQTDVGIDVYGFDTGTGLPRPEDYRDQPNHWLEGQLPMKRDVLEPQLTRARLRLGHVRDTVPAFLDEKPAPVGFVSFDLDLYTSTRDALGVFQAPYEALLPRVISYFDDIMGHTYNDFGGERLAISEFNNGVSMRKLSPIYSLRYFVPPLFYGDIYWDCFYWAHFFEHPLYNVTDSLSKAVFTDDQGRDYRRPVDSDWRRQLLS